MSDSTSRVIAVEVFGEWVGRIEYTPSTGLPTGRTLRGGVYWPNGYRDKTTESCVQFPANLQSDRREVVARLSTQPELRDLVAQIPAAIAVARQVQRDGWRSEWEAESARRVRILQYASAYGYELMWVYPLSSKEELSRYAEWTHGKIHLGLSHDRVTLSFSCFGASTGLADDVRLPTATMRGVLVPERNIGFVPGCENVIYRITEGEEATILQEIAEAKQANADAESQRQAADAEQVRVAVQSARETGAPVKVRRWTEECDGSVEECNLDICVQFAHPDGRLTVSRNHTH